MAIDDFLKFIPEGNDVIRNTMAFILHRPFTITKRDGLRKSPSKKTIDSEYEKLSKFIRDTHNIATHESNILSYLKYAFTSNELVEDRMYALPTLTTCLTFDKKMFNTRGIYRITGIEYKTPDLIKKGTISEDKTFIYTGPSSQANPYGESRFQYNQPLFKLISRALEKNNALLDNGFQSNLYFEYQEGVTRSQILYNAKLLNSLYAGHRRSGSPLHLPPEVTLSQLKPDTVTQSLSYIDLIKLGRDVLRTAFNYPSPQNSSNSSSSPDYRLFIQGTVNPEKKRYEQWLNHRIVEKHLKISSLQIRIPEMKIGSSLEIAQAMEIAQKRGNITANEFREELDMPQLDSDDKDFEFSDKFYIITDRWIVDRQSNSTVIQENSGTQSVQTTSPESNLENNPLPTSKS